MRNLKGELSRLTYAMTSSDDASRIAHRTAQVHAMFKEAIEHIYKANAHYVLEHVNAVYIKREEGSQRKALYVYMDDGNFRSDVHSQQHFILLFIKNRYGEDIEVFKTFPSRMGMKDRRPYADVVEKMQGKKQVSTSIPLSESELSEVSRQGSLIEDERVKKAFMRASQADKEWKKGEQQFQ